MERPLRHRRFPLTLTSLVAITCAVTPGGLQVQTQEEPGTAPVQVEGRITQWPHRASASVGPYLVLPGGARKAAQVALSIGQPDFSPVSPVPHLFALRRVTTTVTPLLELHSFGIENLAVPEVQGRYVLSKYQMPEGSPYTEDGSWRLEQHAIWFDPDLLASETDPRYTGIINLAQVQNWIVDSQYLPGGVYDDSVRAAVRSAAVFKRNQGGVARVGFFADLEDGRVELIFADDPPLGGPPVSYITRTMAGWDPGRGSSIAIKLSKVRNDLDPVEGGLWAIVADPLDGSPVGALLCLGTTAPDDCVREPSGDATIYPLSGVID
jgi:hypothetical protein